MAETPGYPAQFVRSPDSEGSGSDQRAAAKKAAPTSRLGRGLGALIPAAAPRLGPSTSSGAAKPVTVEAKLPVPPSSVSQPATPPAMPPATSSAVKPAGQSESRSAVDLGTALEPAKSPDNRSRAVSPDSRSGASSATSSSVFSETPGGAGASHPATPRAIAAAPDSAPADVRSTWNTSSDQSVVNIPIARIQRNPRQPRERFDDAALRALADSIRQDGLLQPIVVRASRVIEGTSGVQMYELIAGERRLRAFTLLGRSTIPALVHKVDDRTSAVLALIENVQREDLNPMERAHGLQKLMHEFAFSQQDLASRVGLDRSTVANLLRLNDLDAHTAAALREGAITTGHAKALLGLSDVSARKVLVSRIIAEGLSVRELEQAVRLAGPTATTGAAGNRLPATGRVISAQVADLERRIAVHLGADVQLKTGRKPGSGAITIKFGSHSQFEGLMDRIGFDLEASDRPRGR